MRFSMRFVCLAAVAIVVASLPSTLGQSFASSAGIVQVQLMPTECIAVAYQHPHW